MPVRLITYDLNKEPTKRDYAGFYAFIKKHAYARLSESNYAILSSETPESIFKALSAFIDQNDYVLVLTLTSPYSGQNAKAVIDWLNESL